MKKNMQGFTLIELMIVVAIIAILAAIALPAYQDFLKRSKVSEAIVAAGACKTSIADYVATRNAVPADLAASGCASEPSQYVTSLDVAAGVITVAVNATTTGITGGGNIVLTPTTAAQIATGRVGTWTCTTTLPVKYVPASCR